MKPKKDKKMKIQGITLIALVITVLLLLILGGITLNLTIENRGIIENAKLAKIKMDIARIQEKLELEKVELVNEKTFDIALKQYIEHIKQKGIIKEGDSKNRIIDEWNVDLGSCYIQVEGYYFKIEDDDKHSGNLVITYVENILLVRMEENLAGNIIMVNITPEDEASKIKECEYYIKKKREQLEKKGSDTQGHYVYTGIEQDQEYWIEVRITGENGEVVKLGKWITMITNDNLNEGNTSIQRLPEGWTNEDVVATVITTVTGYQVQTSKDGTNWEETLSQIFEENGMVYVRIIDKEGRIRGNMTRPIDNIDKNDPSANITISGETTQTSLPISLRAKVEHSDEESKINIGKCKYVLNTTGTEIGTNEESYTGGTFSTNGQTITIAPNTATKWYLHILTEDYAKNKVETIKEIKIVAKKHNHTGNSTSGGGCYTIPISHTHVNSCYRICGTTKINENIERNENDQHSKNKHYDWTVRCPSCGAIGYRWSTSSPTTEICEKSILNCSKTVNGYNIGCGKTAETIEWYNISY